MCISFSKDGGVQLLAQLKGGSPGSLTPEMSKEYLAINLSGN